MLRKCQDFIEKVGEIRFNKVKNRQINKFNNLIRKEGNITGLSTTFISLQAGRQVGRQTSPKDSTASQEASTVPSHSTPSWESLSQEGNSYISQAGSQAGTSQAVLSLVSSQAGRQVSTPLPGYSATSQEASTSQAGRQASTPIPRAVLLPRKLAPPRQAGRPVPPFPGTVLLPGS